MCICLFFQFYVQGFSILICRASRFLFAGLLNSYLQGFSIFICRVSQSYFHGFSMCVFFFFQFYVQGFSILICRASQFLFAGFLNSYFMASQCVSSSSFNFMCRASQFLFAGLLNDRRVDDLVSDEQHVELPSAKVVRKSQYLIKYLSFLFFARYDFNIGSSVESSFFFWNPYWLISFLHSTGVTQSLAHLRSWAMLWGCITMQVLRWRLVPFYMQWKLCNNQAGDIAKFQCDPGFRLKGGPISYCQQVGMINSSPSMKKHESDWGKPIFEMCWLEKRGKSALNHSYKP